MLSERWKLFGIDHIDVYDVAFKIGKLAIAMNDTEEAIEMLKRSYQGELIFSIIYFLVRTGIICYIYSIIRFSKSVRRF